jgi:hypothetical protein
MRLPSQSQEKCPAPKNFHHWKLLYFLPKRPVLHPGWGSNLFRTKILQWPCPEDPMTGTLNHMEPNPHLLANFSGLWAAWVNLILKIDWWEPRGLYWICGKLGYKILPRNWFGSCIWPWLAGPFSCSPLHGVKNWEFP